MMDCSRLAVAYVYADIVKNLAWMLIANPRLPLGAISRKFKIGRHTIQKAVRIVKGRSFRELQKEAILGRASDLLADGSIRSIKQVSFLIGYGSPQAFSRFMKRVSGRSPSDFRAGVAQGTSRRTVEGKDWKS